MFSSSLSVVEQTPSRLVVVDPPYYWIGFVFLFIGCIVLMAGILAGNQPDAPKSTRLIGILFAMLFLLPATWVLTEKTVLTFSRDTKTLTVQAQKMFFYRNNISVPFSEIDRVAVESGRGTRRLAVLLRSGGAIGIGSHTTQAGQYEVSKAMNDFLAQP